MKRVNAREILAGPELHRKPMGSTAQGTEAQDEIGTAEAQADRAYGEAPVGERAAFWVLYAKGGSFSRFYADLEYSICWHENGKDIKGNPGAVVRNEQFYFISGLTWTQRTQRGFNLRRIPSGAIFDQKAVRKTVSGLIKLLHPNGEVNRGEMEEYVTYAMEMRRRVKEQLKKMGGLEYWDTSFSFADRESGQETFISVPEMGGGRLIVEGVLQAGSVYTIGTDATDNRLALFLVQSQMNRGSGRIIPLGHLSSKMKEAIKTADAYLKAHLKNLGIDHDLKAYDFTIQAINLNQAREGAETSVAFFISMVSIILGRSVQERTVILGEMSVQGMLLKVGSLPERMQLAVEAGARRILIPSENKRDLADVPDAILTAIQWQFYDSPTRAVILALGMG